MAVAFFKGQTLTNADLKIVIRDASGTLVDPYYIRYSLFDYTTGVEVLIGNPDRIPATTGTGQYYVDARIPLDANIGNWLIRWNFRETATSPLIEAVQEFNVVEDTVTVSITGSVDQDLLMKRLRIILGDNNPDRNYRFRPPEHEKFLQSQTQVFGYIWEDEQLYEYLIMAVDDFNTAPPVTGVTLDDLPDRWRTAVILRAASFACFSIAMIWIANEFSVAGDERIQVRDKNCHIYDLTMKELYSILYGDRLDEIDRQVKQEYLGALKELGENTPEDFLSGGKVSVAVEPGSQYEEVKVSFQSGSLDVLSFDTGTGDVVWNPLSDVLRHHTPHKKMIRISTDKGAVTVTEDHSVFLWDSRSPVMASCLKEGDLIVSREASKAVPAVISNIEKVDSQNHSYDVSVSGNENAFMSSRILVHNSYSISGVSLDVEKSSKYESMKNNFITEYDKLKEQAKSSIKIIKGLKMPRYGIGISSALGPYSSPGVQSRRNWVSGFVGG